LQGVLAVQALSRLNRCNDKMQKQDTFILDFYNTATEIKDAFDPFYTATSLSPSPGASPGGIQPRGIRLPRKGGWRQRRVASQGDAPESNAWGRGEEAPRRLHRLTP